MKLTKNIISIDVGTTNLKCVLFENYEIKYQESYHYQQHQIDELYYRMDMNEVLSTIQLILKKIISTFCLKKLDIVLTCAMHSIVLLSNEFKIVSPVLTWADKEGKEQVKIEKNYYTQTGTPKHIMNPYYKLKHLLNNSVQVEKLGSLKDIIFYFLTGEWKIDIACASSSGLMNIKTKCWDKEILTDLGVSVLQLPIIENGDYFNRLLTDYQVQESRVFLGYSDGVSSNAAFCNLSNAAVLSMGTSHAVRIIANKIIIDEAIHNFCYAFSSDQYIIGFPSNNGGNVFDWICATFNLSFEQLIQIVEQRPNITGIFLPYIYGERSPIWKDEPFYSFISHNDYSSKEDKIFSMICGVLFNVKLNVEQLREKFLFDKLALTGGVSHSKALCQLLADILELPLFISKNKNIETFGTIQLIEDDFRKIEYEVIEVINPVYNDYFKQFKKELVNHQLLKIT